MTGLNEVAPQILERAILALENDPLQPRGGNLFLFNHLVEPRIDAAGVDRVLTFVVTSRGVAAGKMATMGLPRHMAGVDAAGSLVFADWAAEWSLPIDATHDVALMPFAGLRSHAERKGWKWSTAEVTDGMLARAGDRFSLTELAAYGYEPAYPDHLVGHSRPELRPVKLSEEQDGSLTFEGAPAWLSGAPVLAVDRMSKGESRFLVMGMVGSADDVDKGPGARLPFTPGWIIRSAAAEIYQRLVQS